jgi:hypothetical protein
MRHLQSTPAQAPIMGVRALSMRMGLVAHWSVRGDLHSSPDSGS